MSIIFKNNPVDGDLKIGCKFGKRTHPITKLPDFHNGVDLEKPLNTPLKSVNEGYVILSQFHKSLGNYTVISHDGFCTVYAHMSRKGLPAGTKVKAGDTIGYVGSTGMSSGPHLHFEVREGNYRSDSFFWDRVNGKYANSIDPEQFFVTIDEIERLVAAVAPALGIGNQAYWVRVLKGDQISKSSYLIIIFENLSNFLHDKLR